MGTFTLRKPGGGSALRGGDLLQEVLRTANDIYLPTQIMAALASVLVPNTRMEQSASIYENDYTAILTNAPATWPVLILHESTQSAARIGIRLWQRKLTLIAEYFDRWDQQSAKIPAIWALVDQDLRRMAANLEDNPTLTVGNIRYVKGVIHIELSPYMQTVGKGDVLTPDGSTAPFPLVRRYMTLSINTLPYPSAA